MRAETGILTTQGPVARIRTHAGAVCGTGLLVGDRHVMTCAHVVDDAVPGRRRGDVAAPGETEKVTLDLPFLDRRSLTAKVVAWRPMVNDVEGSPVSDIAVLELEDGVPGGLDPREAVLSAPSPGTAFTTWGFPRNMDGGAEAGGELRMRDAGGWRHIQDIQDHGYFVEPGFSGAPVFDAEAGRHGARRLLGMVVADDRDKKKRLAFVIPTPTLGRAWPLLVRPYKGLDAFEAEDADLFFGREEKIGELADKIARRSFVALIGPSGSGKSSLVLAGLVPQLRAGCGWTTATFKPRSNPLYSLAEALASLSPGRVGDGLVKRATELADRLQTEPRHVLDYVPTALDGIPGAERLLLVVDQFEELFTLVHKPGAIEDPATPHGAFATVLDLIGAQPPDEGSIRVVATLRADFTGHALRHEVVERLMTDADVKLGPMTPADLTNAVAKPAERFDVAFDPGLVSEIVARMRDSRGGLPLMQFALDRLWQRQENRRLTEENYRAIGGVEGALNEHAEAFREDLGTDDQIALRRTMTRLVTLADPGTGGEDTRAVATRHEIGEADWDLVGRLAKARLVTTGGAGGEAGTETAEIAHEALIRAWDTLRAWLDEDRTFALWRQRLQHDVERWDGSNDDALLRGELLAEAEGWKKTRAGDLNDVERTYIGAGIAKREAELKTARDRQRVEAEKETKQREERFHFLVGTSVALASLLIVVGVLWLNAADARDAAELAARESLARRLAAEARLTMTEFPGAVAAERAAVLAVESWRLEPTPLAYQVAAQSMRELPLLRFEHGGWVNVVAFSPDGTYLATGSDDGTARLLNAATGEEIGQINHGNLVWKLAYSPNGDRISITTHDHVTRSFAADTGDEISRIEHGTGVTAFSYSSLGGRIATGNRDGTARILDAETGAEIARIEHLGWIVSVAFSPDAAYLATGSANGTVRIFASETGEEIARINNYGDFVLTLAFSPDSARLATGSGDGTAHILDAGSGEEIARIEHDGPVGTVVFSPDGARLATGSGDGTAHILDAGTGEEIARIEHDGPVGTVVFSPDGTRLATGSSDGTARILDAATGAEIARAEHDSPILTLAYSPDGDRLATGSDGGTARIFEAKTGDEIIRIEHGDLITNLAFSLDGGRLATSNSRDTARIFNAKTGGEIIRITHGDAVENLAVSPHGARLATGNSEGTVRIFDAQIGDEIASIKHGDVTGSAIRSVSQEVPVYALAFSQDGTRLVSGNGGFSTSKYAAIVSDASTGKEIRRIELDAEIYTAAFSPHGTSLAIGSGDGTLRVLNEETGDEIALIDHGDAVETLAYSPDGTRLATGSSDGIARILDAKTGDEIARIEHGVPVKTLAFSFDGARLATSSGVFLGNSDKVRVLDAETGDEIARIEHFGRVRALSFSPDGVRLAADREDGSARIFDAKTGNEIARIKQGDAVETLVFNPDGTRLATSGSDGNLHIFNTNPHKLFDRLCTERAGRNLKPDEWRRFIGEHGPWRETCPEWRNEEFHKEERAILSSE